MSKTSTARIHHATAALAAKSGVDLKANGSGFIATHESGKKAKGPTAKDALKKVLELVKNGEVEGEGDDENVGNVVVKEKYKKIYAEHGGNCGDNLASSIVLFRQRTGDSEKAFLALCKENSVDHKQWAGRNLGIRFMSLSNILRNRVRHGEKVTIDGHPVTRIQKA